MFHERQPILYSCASGQEQVELYCVHDVHFGNECFDGGKWERLKAEILSQPNRYVAIVGDMMENALPTSKGDVFSQTHSPQEQKEWVTQQFIDLKDRICVVVAGNHEYNRTTKSCGLYPLYDCCLFAGIGDLYRNAYAILDIGVGSRGNSGKQTRYVGYIIHKARDNKQFSSADTVEGIDFTFYGHDHDPKDHPRARLVYDTKNKVLSVKNVEVIDGGAFLDYGGYAALAPYRPASSKMYKVLFDGKNKDIKTIGFYV